MARTATSKGSRGVSPAFATMKQALSKAFAGSMETLDLNQREMSERIREPASQISLVATGKTDGFSTDRLETMLARAGFNVVHVITPTHNAREGKISVKIES